MTWTHNFPADCFSSGSDAFPHRHLLGIAGLQNWEILYVLKEAEQWVAHPKTVALECRQARQN